MRVPYPCIAALTATLFVLCACTPFTKIQDDGKGEAKIDGSWTVMHDGSKKIEGLNPPATVLFETGSNRLSGFDGCNKFQGSYVFEGGLLKARISSTRMACKGEAERTVSSALNKLLSEGAEVVSIEIYSAKALLLRNKTSGVELRLGATEQINQSK